MLRSQEKLRVTAEVMSPRASDKMGGKKGADESGKEGGGQIERKK